MNPSAAPHILILMTEASHDAPQLRDPALPALRDLLGGGAVELLNAAAPCLAPEQDAAASERLRVTSARPVQTSWRPGRSLAVRYVARIETARGSRDEALVAYTASRMPPRAVHLQGPAGSVAVWQLADDPWLPGLRVALDPVRVRALLATLDVPPAPVHLSLRAYRAGRRAVVQVETGGRRLFLKVLRPDRIARLQARHAALEPVLPVPRSHGWSPEYGLVVLQAMPGETLRAALDSGASVPPPSALRELLDRLPAVDDGLAPRSPLRSALGHLELLGQLAPSAHALIERLRAAFEAAAASPTSSPRRPIHGDFHPGQLLVEGGTVTALLDVDTVTLGERVSDWATLIAHLDAPLHQLPWGPMQPAATRLLAYRDAALARADAEVGEQHLRTQVAAATFGLATGPFRVQSPRWPAETLSRIQRAAAWLDGVPGAEALQHAPARAGDR